MKKQVLLIQGGGQGAYEADGKLAESLRDALGAEYHVQYPRMPNEGSPEYELWKAQIETELAALASEVILVGHSLGGSILLKLLSEQKIKQSIAGLFLVASPYWGGDEDWGVDEYTLQANFAALLPKGPPIFFYHSRDDNVVPFAHLALYARKLSQATIREFNGRGHSFTEVDFPELIRDIRNL